MLLTMSLGFEFLKGSTKIYRFTPSMWVYALTEIGQNLNWLKDFLQNDRSAHPQNGSKGGGKGHEMVPEVANENKYIKRDHVNRHQTKPVHTWCFTFAVTPELLEIKKNLGLKMKKKSEMRHFNHTKTWWAAFVTSNHQIFRVAIMHALPFRNRLFYPWIECQHVATMDTISWMPPG